MSVREDRAIGEAAYLLSVAHRVAPLAVTDALTALKMTGQVDALLADHRKARQQAERVRQTEKPASP
jgi:hypothetical protein